jgi:predicted phage replisome organizer
VSDNKKYYYLKLKDNFFDGEEMIILQNMQDGYLYSDILFKMYLRSLKNEGKLMFNDLIPYTPQVLAQIVRHQVGTVEKAIDIFNKLGLIELMDDGAIYMLHIQNFIGHSSSEADRQRAYQKKIKEEKSQKKITCKKSNKESNRKTTPEIEIEIEIEKEKEIELKKKRKFTPPTLDEVSGYVSVKGYCVDPDFFYQYYTESNWKDVKGNQVKNWKLKLLTWHKREMDKKPPPVQMAEFPE